MSKSLGNFFTIREVLSKYDAETVRFFLVRTHYRTALNYSDVHLNDARNSLKRLYTALDLVAPASVVLDWNDPYAARFKAAMDEDFGTPEAVAVLFELAAEVNRTKSAELAGLLKALGACLGLLQAEPKSFLQWFPQSQASDERLPTVPDSSGAFVAQSASISGSASRRPSNQFIDELIAQRSAAKSAKNFAEADRIRKQLLEQGIVLKDSPTGTTWEAAQ